jgi:hypothetical protein
MLFGTVGTSNKKKIIRKREFALSTSSGVVDFDLSSGSEIGGTLTILAKTFLNWPIGGKTTKNLRRRIAT